MPDAAHLLHAWFSPAYPVGAFSYSHGLEQAIAQGIVTSAATLQSWLSDLLRHGAARTDAILLAHAARAPDSATRDDLAALAEALAPGSERYLETMAMGRAFATVTAAVWNTDATPHPYPVAVGVACGALGVPVDHAISLYLHAFAANLISAAVRFVPLGQTDGQRVLAALFPLIGAVAAEACGAPLDDIGGCALRADILSMHHETLTTRIFRT